MTITATTVAPNENAVISASTFTVQAKASSDAGTISGAQVVINNGTPLAMTFDAASQS